VVPGLIFAISALLKPLSSNKLCGFDPWGLANAVMMPAEILLAWFLLSTRKGLVDASVVANRRRLAALFGALLMAGAMALLTFLHFWGPLWNMAGADISGCGCFGPIELPYGVHMAVLGGMVACLVAVFLHEETVFRERPQPTVEDGSTRNCP
jgi:hypothetical protein